MIVLQFIILLNIIIWLSMICHLIETAYEETNGKFDYNNHIAYRKNGMFHREDGPAIVWKVSQYKEYWYKGTLYKQVQSDLEWILKVEELKSR